MQTDINDPRTWILLVYTVPAQPTRKRALVWRELKKIGAVYLRDGVAVLREQPAALEAFHSLAAKIEAMSGRATLVTSAAIAADAATRLIAEGREARAAEYEEIAREATAFLDHLQREAPHRELGSAELDALDVDIGKLRRWIEQVQARDRFGAGPADKPRDLVEQCARALQSLVHRKVSVEVGP